MNKKYLLILLLSIFLVACNNDQEVVEVEPETYIISGTITDKDHMRYSNHFIVETEDGIKVPVCESVYSGFTRGLEIGDKVRFEVINEGDGYKVVGIIFSLDEEGTNEY